MRTVAASLLPLLLIVAGCSTGVSSPRQAGVPRASAQSAVPKDALSNLHHSVSTKNPEAQRHFDEGLTLCYAFNHDEAIRSFKKALAADPNLKRKSGGIYNSGALAEEYGFTDVDGSRPNMYRYMKEHFPQLVSGKPATAVEWKIVSPLPATFQPAGP